MVDKIKNLRKTIKEIGKLVWELELLIIKIISLIGWLYILITNL